MDVKQFTAVMMAGFCLYDYVYSSTYKLGNNMLLKEKVVFVSGASRGVGKEIAIKAGLLGAHVYITAKTAEPHAKLPGTIYTAAEEIAQAGAASVTPIVCDIRELSTLESAIKQAGDKHGVIDVLVNNASALYLLPSDSISQSKFDLMQQIIVRASFFAAQYALPYLKKSEMANIMNIAPALDIKAKWFNTHTAYTLCKFASSMMVTGLSHEFKSYGVRVNALWPATFLHTAAVEFVVGGDALEHTRHPRIMADAAMEILLNKQGTGEFYLDHQVIKEMGGEPSSYDMIAGKKPQLDIYVEETDLT